MFEVEFGPAAGGEVVDIGFVGDDEFVWVSEGVLLRETAPPNMTALLGETMVKVCPKRGVGRSPLVLTFSAVRVFIQKLTL